MRRFACVGALCAISIASVAPAAPTVSAVSGTISDGEALVVVGNGFGATGVQQLWLGGKDGLIDSQADGTRVDRMSIPSLTLLGPSTNTYPHVSSERGWSNGKSIAFDVRGTTEYKQSFFYDLGAEGYSTLYTNAVIYLTHDNLAAGSYLQWKMMRWTKTATVVDGDGAYMSNRPPQTSFFGPSRGGVSPYWFESPSQNLPGRGAWYRYETWVTINSSSGARDGKFRVKVTNPVSGAVVVDNSYSDVAYLASGESGRFRFLVLQNYFGNASDSGSGQADNANAAAWWDDIFVSRTEARVELCSASTWAQCVNREIQPSSQWGDSSISIRLNKGAISDLSNTYLYVTNERGEVNSLGYRLIASGPRPSSPTLQVR